MSASIWGFIYGLVWGISLGMVIIIQLLDRFQRKRPKTLNLSVDELQKIQPGHVYNIVGDGFDVAVLNSADLEFVAERASMRLKMQSNVKTGEA